MLSLLSLLLASGTVLRPDTEPWTSCTYPDPRGNFTRCNTWTNSTLCDPDHILTEQWRSRINTDLNKLTEKLRSTPMEYTEEAPNECYNNSTVSLQFYIILAKRIQTINNQSINESDMTKFGDGLVEKLGLKESSCKNFVIFVGVEAAKMAYVRTGSDLKLPQDLMKQIFNQYNLFKAKNFMEVLNKVVNEIGDKIADPLLENKSADNMSDAETAKLMQALTNDTEALENVTITMQGESSQLPTRWPLWLLGVLILAGITALLALVFLRENQRQRLNDYANSSTFVRASSSTRQNSSA